MEYVTYDFETANRKRSSACSLGAVKVSDGKIVDQFESLINPEEDFEQRNINIHGITSPDVEDKPNFVEVFAHFLEFCNGLPIISHSGFDRGVIISATKKHNYQFDEIKYMDSLLLARTIWKGKYFKFGLKPLAQELGFNFKHHDALDDAKASAFIIEELIKYTKSDSLLDLQLKADYNGYGTLTTHGSDNSKKITKNLKKKVNNKSLTQTEIDNLVNEVDHSKLDKNHLFYNKVIAITGKIADDLSRDQCKLAIIAVGGHPKNTINKDTDIFIEGKPTAHNLIDGKSNKYRKAHELFDNGNDITFYSGDEFLEIIDTTDLE